MKFALQKAGFISFTCIFLIQISIYFTNINHQKLYVERVYFNYFFIIIFFYLKQKMFIELLLLYFKQTWIKFVGTLLSDFNLRFSLCIIRRHLIFSSLFGLNNDFSYSYHFYCISIQNKQFWKLISSYIHSCFPLFGVKMLYLTRRWRQYLLISV